MNDRPSESSQLHILVSAYSCAPGMGSEPGAGWSLLEAAAEVGECWVLTRKNNVPLILEALKREPPRYEVHVQGIDLKPWVLGLKRRLGGVGVRFYYVAWQRLARKEALRLTARVGFDIAHHATFSSFWLPVGIDKLECPLVIGPLSGGERTPPGFYCYLGVRGALTDLLRMLITSMVSAVVGARWRRRSIVFVSQSREMARFAERFVGPRSRHITFSHALNPDVGLVSARPREREVLFVGRLVPWKGVALAIDAVAAADIDVRFTIVGEGSDRRRLERRARRRGLEGSVEFVGALDRTVLGDRMAGASALLFPSFHDSAGFVVSEALTMGLPVICLDHAGPGEIVSQWPPALSVAVPLGSRKKVVNNLALALRTFAENPTPHPPTPILARQSLAGLVNEAYQVALDLHKRELPTH